jgi:hypothetical protein
LKFFPFFFYLRRIEKRNAIDAPEINFAAMAFMENPSRKFVTLQAVGIVIVDEDVFFNIIFRETVMSTQPHVILFVLDDATDDIARQSIFESIFVEQGLILPIQHIKSFGSTDPDISFFVLCYGIDNCV